jgi:hypothetical protein
MPELGVRAVQAGERYTVPKQELTRLSSLQGLVQECAAGSTTARKGLDYSFQTLKMRP